MHNILTIKQLFMNTRQQASGVGQREAFTIISHYIPHDLSAEALAKAGRTPHTACRKLSISGSLYIYALYCSALNLSRQSQNQTT